MNVVHVYLPPVHSFLQTFASNEGEYISMDQEDVKLACSILLNNKFESDILFDNVMEMEKETGNTNMKKRMTRKITTNWKHSRNRKRQINN